MKRTLAKKSDELRSNDSFFDIILKAGHNRESDLESIIDHLGGVRKILLFLRDF